MGVVLGYMVKGPVHEMLASRLRETDLYNLYKSIKCISSWGTNPEEVRERTKGVFHRRNQIPGESLYTYSGDLIFYAELIWPEPEYSRAEIEEKVTRRFIKGLEPRLETIKVHMMGEIEMGRFTSLDTAIMYVKNCSRGMETSRDLEEESERFRLRLHEARHKQFAPGMSAYHKSTVTSEAFSVEDAPPRGYGAGRVTRGRGDGPKRWQGSDKNRSAEPKLCWGCLKPGHFKLSCTTNGYSDEIRQLKLQNLAARKAKWEKADVAAVSVDKEPTVKPS